MPAENKSGYNPVGAGPAIGMGLDRRWQQRPAKRKIPATATIGNTRTNYAAA